MKRWLPWVLLLLSVGFNVGVLGRIAAERRRVETPVEIPTRPEAPRFGVLAERLGLEGAQREKFMAIQRRFHERTRRELAELARRRAAVRHEVMRPRPDRQRIGRLTEELGGSYAELDRAFVDNVLASRELLNPRQERLFFRFLTRLRAGVMEQVRRRDLAAR